MKRGITLFLIMLIVPWMLEAQENVRSLSLQQAIEQAMKYNKQLQASKMDIEIYKQKVREAISQGLPQINGTLDYSTNFNHKMNFGGNAITMKDQSNFKGTVSQLIFSGSWIVALQSSKLAEHLIEQQVGITELDIVKNIYASYYTILVTERMKETLSRNLQNMNEIYQHTKNMYDAGTVELTDVDQIRMTVGQLKNSLLAMERTVEVNYNLLRLQLGLSSGTPMTLTDQLETFLDEGKIVALIAQKFDLEKNPEFRLMETQAEVSRKALHLERWSYAPTISGTYMYTHKIKKPGLDMSANQTANVSMSIPVFSGFGRKSKVEQAKISLEKTRMNQSLLEDQLKLQDEQLKFELNNALENYNLQKENIEVATNVLKNYQQKFQYGAISSLDLTQANTNYLTAESNYTSAILTLLQAQLNLERLYNQLSR